MSGVWIKLREIRVRVDQGDGDFWEVARALTALYEGQVIEDVHGHEVETKENMNYG